MSPKRRKRTQKPFPYPVPKFSRRVTSAMRRMLRGMTLEELIEAHRLALASEPKKPAAPATTRALECVECVVLDAGPQGIKAGELRARLSSAGLRDTTVRRAYRTLEDRGEISRENHFAPMIHRTHAAASPRRPAPVPLVTMLTGIRAAGIPFAC